MSLQRGIYKTKGGGESFVPCLQSAAPVQQRVRTAPAGRLSRRESCASPLSNGEAVRVAVRVRPSLRSELSQENIITMDPSQQTVFLQGTGSEHTAFSVDNPVWSGVGNALDGSAPVSQAVLYEQIGQPLLFHALEGFNSTLIAYGQTGSGKTHTMMGEVDPSTNDDEDALLESEEGITPRFCRELFQQIQQNSFTAPCGGEISWEVHLRFVEVYCERIIDLLKNGDVVTLREEVVDDEMRFVLVGAKRMRVSTTAEILRALRLGNRYRKTVATAQNERSSRSHAVVIIELTEVLSFTGADGNVTSAPSKTVTVRLVDLAGSERLAETGATGKQFKEGVDINLSLFTLGMVIESLADPRRRGIRPPYRESTLTKLLKDAFGGNSKTRVICTISPTAGQRSQTLQTLQYATKARCVVNKPRADEDPVAMELRRANAELLQLRSALSDARRSTRHHARVKAEMVNMRGVLETIHAQYAEQLRHKDAESHMRASALLVDMEKRLRTQLSDARMSEMRLLRVLWLHGGAASDSETASVAALSAAAVAAAVQRLRDEDETHIRAYLCELEAEDAQREARHCARELAIAQSYRTLLLREAGIGSNAIAAAEESARALIAGLYTAGADTLSNTENNDKITEKTENAERSESRQRLLALEAEARVQVLRAREAEAVRRRNEAAAAAVEHERMLGTLEADLAELLAGNRAAEAEIARRDAEIARERRCYAELRRLLEDRERRLRSEHAHRMDGKDSAVQLTDDLLDANEMLKRQLAMWMQKYKVLKTDQKIECEQCSYHNRQDATACRCCGNAQLV